MPAILLKNQCCMRRMKFVIDIFTSGKSLQILKFNKRIGLTYLDWYITDVSILDNLMKR